MELLDWVSLGGDAVKMDVLKYMTHIIFYPQIPQYYCGTFIQLFSQNLQMFCKDTFVFMTLLAKYTNFTATHAKVLHMTVFVLTTPQAFYFV